MSCTFPGKRYLESFNDAFGPISDLNDQVADFPDAANARSRCWRETKRQKKLEANYLFQSHFAFLKCSNNTELCLLVIRSEDYRAK